MSFLIRLCHLHGVMSRNEGTFLQTAIIERGDTSKVTANYQCLL